MSTISSAAESARENSRQSDGRFGEQHKTDPGQVIGVELSGVVTEVRVGTMALGFTEEHLAWAGDFADDFDWDKIGDDYNDELDRLAPEGVSWGWFETGPWCQADINLDPEYVQQAWLDANNSIDFDAIAYRHDRTNTTGD